MRLLLLIQILTLFGLLRLGRSTSCAQSNTLLHCQEILHKTRQAINQSRVPNQQSLFPTLDPTYQQHKQNYENWEACVKGQKAPLTAFKTVDGKSYDTAALLGKIIVINFWSTSCAPCIVEMPALNKLVKEYKEKNVIFLGFAGDRMASLSPTFFEKHPFDFQIVAEARNLMFPFYSTALPTTYVVDQRGIIQRAWIGLEGYSEIDKMAPYNKAKVAIDELLTGPAK